MKELDTNTILALLGPQHHKPYSTSNAPVQTSKFVRWYDVSLRCASRGCSSPTYLKLQGVPYCMKHAVHKMDELLNSFAAAESLAIDGAARDSDADITSAAPTVSVASSDLAFGEL